MINENIEFLLNIDDEEWGQYSFSRDPLKKKVNDKLKEEMIKKANECGKKFAINLKNKYSNLSVQEIAKEMDLEIIEEEANTAHDYVMFACYNSPNKITLFKNNTILFKKFVSEYEIGEKLSYVDIKSVLIAHEMFHYIEEIEKDIYTKTAKIVLWKIGGYEYKSKLVALGEIAAMAFAKEILLLSYNPYVFDVLMLYPHNKDLANKLFDEVKKFKGEVKNE